MVYVTSPETTGRRFGCLNDPGGCCWGLFAPVGTPETTWSLVTSLRMNMKEVGTFDPGEKLRASSHRLSGIWCDLIQSVIVPRRLWSENDHSLRVTSSPRVLQPMFLRGVGDFSSLEFCFQVSGEEQWS